jgi:nucleoid-associated protein YgaU
MGRQLRLPAVSTMQRTTLYQVRDPQDDNVLLNDYAWGTWEPVDFPPDASDQSYVVQRKDIGALDHVSEKFYATPDLWWVIAHANDITDPTSDDPNKGGIATGTRLRIPSRDRVVAILSRGRTLTTAVAATPLQLPTVRGGTPLL